MGLLSVENADILVFLVLCLSALASWALIPPVKAFANKIGAIDVPKDERRMHKTPIPRLGGLAIFTGDVAKQQYRNEKAHKYCESP